MISETEEYNMEIVHSNISDRSINEKSFLDSALKHHSKAQAAIKLLQDQLDYLDDLRKSSSKSILSVTSEEKDLEKSTSRILSSANDFLLESPDNKRISHSPILSSTVKKLEKPKDFISSTEAMSPIKASQLQNLSKDNLASTALPLTSVSNPHLSVTVLNDLDHVKSLHASLEKHDMSLPRSNGVLSLTGILSKLAYGSAVTPPADSSETANNVSDELIHVLENIAHSAGELQNELQNSKARESRLLDEIHTLRSKLNGVLSTRDHHVTSDVDIEMKCRKLEDAMLFLQEENVKLNRLIKENSSSHLDVELADTSRVQSANQSENKLLHATINRMKAQLAYYEERHNRNRSSPENSLVPAQPNPESKSAEVIIKLKERINNLEKELLLARADKQDQKNFQSRIDEMHSALLQRDKQIEQCEKDLESAFAENKILVEKLNDLQQKDVYKRKEVLMLCDKFEQMKAKYLKLETQVLRFQDNSDNRLTAEESIHKFLLENEALHSRLAAEQRELKLSKLHLEKDYRALKRRYDNLLCRLSGLEQDQILTPIGIKDPILAEHDHDRLVGHQNSIESLPKPISAKKPRSKKHHQPIQTNIPHSRRHTAPSRIYPLHRLPTSPLEARNRSENDLYLNQPKLKGSSSLTSIGTLPSGGKKATVPPCTCGYKVNGFSDEQNGVASPPLTVLANKNSPEMVEVPRSRAFEDEYAHNMGVAFRSRSSCELKSDRHEKYHDEDRFQLRSKSEIFTPKYSTPSRKRLHTAPSNLTPNRTSTSPAAATPFASEYLSNMDGVRLLVSLDNSGQNLNQSKYNLLPGESITKTALANESVSSIHQSTTTNETILQTSEKTSTVVTSPILNTTNAGRSLMSSNPFEFRKSSLSSSSSEDSLHLSDLPCDQTTVVDKFRNFDDYKQPPPVINGGIIEQRKPLSPRELNCEDVKPPLPPSLKPKDHSKHVLMRNLNELPEVKSSRNRTKTFPEKENKKQSRIIKRDEVDTLDQSSASTTRDHVGRIEFLRDIQINSGMRLMGVVRDTSLKDAVLLNDSDLNGEVKLGLSNNQEAYAEKLVKKYTKNAGKILDCVL